MVGQRSDGHPILSVSSLTKRYQNGGSTVTAADDVSFNIERGSVVGILGPNGAGKTTTIKCILGITTPTSGDVLIDGESVLTNREHVYRMVSAMLEGARNTYWRMTVEENIHYFMSHAGMNPREHSDRINSLIRFLDLSEKKDTPVRELSRGMKQKAAIACVYARQRPLLILDEPTLGLDVEATRTLRKQLIELTTESDRTVVLSSHDMDTVQQLCDRVIVMSQGSVIADEPTNELTGLFQTQTYEFQFVDATADSVSGLLEETSGTVVDSTTAESTVTISFDNPDELFEFISQLREANIVPQRIDHTGGGLEEAYLRLVSQEELNKTETIK